MASHLCACECVSSACWVSCSEFHTPHIHTSLVHGLAHTHTLRLICTYEQQGGHGNRNTRLQPQGSNKSPLEQSIATVIAAGNTQLY